MGDAKIANTGIPPNNAVCIISIGLEFSVCCRCRQATSRHVISHVTAVHQRRLTCRPVTSPTPPIPFPLPVREHHRANHVTIATMTSRQLLPVATRWTGRASCAARSMRCSLPTSDAHRLLQMHSLFSRATLC